MKRTLNGLGYRAVQARNRNEFHKLNKFQQKGLRAKGYKNVGWDSVICSWDMIQEILIELVEVVNLPPTSITEKRKEKIWSQIEWAQRNCDYDSIKSKMLELSNIDYEEALRQLEEL